MSAKHRNLSLQQTHVHPNWTLLVFSQSSYVQLSLTPMPNLLNEQASQFKVPVHKGALLALLCTNAVLFRCRSLGNFITTAEKIRLPDDCTIGYIIEALLEVPLIHTNLFHSHLENLQRMPAVDVLRQVSVTNYRHIA